MSNHNPPTNGFNKHKEHINRKGRPKDFDAARELAQQIAHETAKDKDGSDIVINGHRVTVIEAVLRSWAMSKNPQLQQAFVWYAYGKPPESHEFSGKDGGPISVETMTPSEIAARVIALKAVIPDESG